MIFGRENNRKKSAKTLWATPSRARAAAREGVETRGGAGSRSLITPQASGGERRAEDIVHAHLRMLWWSVATPARRRTLSASLADPSQALRESSARASRIYESTLSKIADLLFLTLFKSPT